MTIVPAGVAAVYMQSVQSKVSESYLQYLGLIDSFLLSAMNLCNQAITAKKMFNIKDIFQRG